MWKYTSKYVKKKNEKCWNAQSVSTYNFTYTAFESPWVTCRKLIFAVREGGIQYGKY